MSGRSRAGIKNNILLIAGILLLAVIIAVSGYLNFHKAVNGGAGLQDGKITVTAGGATIKELTLDDLKRLPAAHKKMTIHSSRGTAQHDFSGTSLLGVLNSIDPDLTRQYTRIVSRGADNYTSVIGMPEVLLPDNVYLVYEDFDKPLKTVQGKDGAVQVIICSDEFGQRFTNWLVSLELQ
ncbi:MAG: hypothetical protein ABSC17_01930 [Thermacetogeniaceae bacterium]